MLNTAGSKLKKNEKAMKVVIGLNNGLRNVPVRIEPGQSSVALLPFNNNNTVEFLIKLAAYKH